PPHDSAALTSRNRIAPADADMPVIEWASPYRFVARASHKRVIAWAAFETVVPAAPDESVVADTAEQRELARDHATAVDDVVAGSRIHDGIDFEVSEGDAIVAAQGVHAHARTCGKP